MNFSIEIKENSMIPDAKAILELMIGQFLDTCALRKNGEFFFDYIANDLLLLAAATSVFLGKMC
ncbi:MAG: hypothetical protein A4S08_09425 [Proteobacteria bacterium SG_bin4]|nr:MAG: hypothetical protein A4S08_09425 [Proteobacteria bacterium SG_bin4]